MAMTGFSHVNVRTSRLREMIAFYGELLGMHPGPRPNFSFDGAWLYLGDDPFIHLVEVASEPRAAEPKIEHYAFYADDMAGFVGKLEARGVDFTVDPVPGFPIVQINLHDPDGNHIHIDFTREEAAAAGLA